MIPRRVIGSRSSLGCRGFALQRDLSGDRFGRTAIAWLGRRSRRLLRVVHASPASAAVIDPAEKSKFLDAIHARRA
jgi:hypothetical protein